MKTNQLIYSLFLLCAVSATTHSCRAENASQARTAAPGDTISLQPNEHRLSIIVAGDLMQHGPQIRAAMQPDGTYSYAECFARVKDEIERADVAIGNFEVTLGGRPYTGYPQFRAPDEYLQACLDAGFDILLTANNHCLDSRRKGLERTLQLMDSVGVPHLGTYANSAERRDCYPFVLEQNGIRLVLLNFTYGTNGIPVEAPNMVNLIDTVQIHADIEKARLFHPDAIIAIPHWGIEYQQLPSDEQRSIAKWLIDHGVDHVIGGHPHVAQPLELTADSAHLVAWSLGNVISNQSKPNTYGGYMVRMEFAKRDSMLAVVGADGRTADTLTTRGRTRLADCGYTLYWVSRPDDNGRRHNYRILPIDEPDAALTDTEQKNRAAIRTSMRRLMQKHTKGISEYSFQ